MGTPGRYEVGVLVRPAETAIAERLRSWLPRACPSRASRTRVIRLK